MEEDVDKLTDFERAEYYRRLYKGRGLMIVIFSILSFAIGFVLSQYVHIEFIQYGR